MSNTAWSFTEAREACRLASKAQAAAENKLRDSARALAQAEERYRVALAKRVTELRLTGEAATLCGDLARGDKTIAALKRDRDVAEGVYQAFEHAAWRHTADRKDCARFADWSMRRDVGQAEWQPVFAEASG